MEAYKERMVIELKELDDKITKLSQFIMREDSATSVGNKVSAEEVSLLVDQLTAMEEYIVILLKRIRLSFTTYDYASNNIEDIMNKYSVKYIKRFV